MMNVYSVKYDEGATGPYVKKFKAINAGQAFQKCLKEYPEARLIEAWREGSYKDGYGITSYQSPSMAKVEAEPAPGKEQMKFDF
jgi:hypothetical protein